MIQRGTLCNGAHGTVSPCQRGGDAATSEQTPSTEVLPVHLVEILLPV